MRSPSPRRERARWPSIPGLGTTGGFEFYIQNRGSGDPRATDEAVKAFIAKARQRPELQGVNTTFRASSQQLFVDLDRNKAEVLGVPVQDVFQTMQTLFGSQVAGQFSQFSPFRPMRSTASIPMISARCTCVRRAAPMFRCRR
jgi:multidrug efflux pump subunit AcrB